MQIAFAGERLHRELKDRRHHRAEQIGALVGGRVALPVGDQAAIAALDDQQPVDLRRAVGQHELADRASRCQRLDPTHPQLRRGQRVDALLERGDHFPERIRNRGADQAADDRIERLDHLLARILDLVPDRGDDDRCNRGREFARPVDLGALQRLHQDAGGCGLKPVSVANIALQRVELGLQRRQTRRLGLKQQCPELLDLAVLAGSGCHGYLPVRPDPNPLMAAPSWVMAAPTSFSESRRFCSVSRSRSESLACRAVTSLVKSACICFN